MWKTKEKRVRIISAPFEEPRKYHGTHHTAKTLLRETHTYLTVSAKHQFDPSENKTTPRTNTTMCPPGQHERSGWGVLKGE